MIYETIKTFNEKREIKRVKTSIILWSGFACIPLGVILISNGFLFGATLIFILSPILFIYPLIRYFIFGGRDSVAAVVTTAVVEEVVKSKIIDSITDHKKK
tara:strand:+ start:177 stop:479 length:303 start_codon:yes stop_codon:yes gene_type:complete